MPPSPTRRAELDGRLTREAAFIIGFWNLHHERKTCGFAGPRHNNWTLCPLYVLRWGR